MKPSAALALVAYLPLAHAGVAYEVSTRNLAIVDAKPVLSRGYAQNEQRAAFHVQASGKKEVGVVNVLVAIFSERQSQAAFLLAGARVTRLAVVKYIAAIGR